MAPFLPLLFLPIFFGLMAVLIVHIQKQMRIVNVGGRTYPTAEEFVARVSPELGLWGTVSGPSQGPLAAHFSGTLADGTLAQVSYSSQAGKQPAYMAHLAVAAPSAPSLVVSREPGLQDLLVLIGWRKRFTTGDRAFDSSYLVETTDPRAAAALARPELRDEIENAFVFSAVTKLELGRGGVVLTAQAGPLFLDAYGQLLARLARIARDFERSCVTVRLLGVERHEHARCGYCHADVSDEDPRLVACDRCSTVVHDECWAELERCPVAGCTGGAPRRPVRAAA